ncbi:hypothetical protein MOB39_04570 [Bacillus spizizenii]|nr:hypothetical protein [Bacillus spizizenii]
MERESWLALFKIRDNREIQHNGKDFNKTGVQWDDLTQFKKIKHIESLIDNAILLE